MHKIPERFSTRSADRAFVGMLGPVVPFKKTILTCIGIFEIFQCGLFQIRKHENVIFQGPDYY